MSVRKLSAKERLGFLFNGTLPPPPTPEKEDMYVKVISLQKEKGKDIIKDLPKERTLDIPPEAVTTLYRIDPLVWRCVQNYIEGIASEYIVEGENPNDTDDLKKWIENVGLLYLIQDGIRDIFLNGNWWIELLPDYTNKSLGLRYLNPRIMDYIRKASSSEIELLDDGSPKGFVANLGTTKIEWTSNMVTKGNVPILRSATEDLRTRVAHFKLYSYGESLLGITPLTAVFKSALIRLNMADMIGEASFRGGGIVAYVPASSSEQTKTNLETDLQNITTRNVFVFDERIKLNTVPTPELAGTSDLIYYFADEVAGAGFGIPLALIMTTGRVPYGERQNMAVRFETSIKPLQKRIAFQVRDQIFKKLWEVWNKKSEVPMIRFVGQSPATQMDRSRQVATLARRSLINRDPELELRLREELGLPKTIIQKELKEWLDTNRKVATDTQEKDKRID